MEIRNESLINNTSNSKGKRILKIKNKLPDGKPVKLGHIFNFLPHGIIDKTITGLGGTTLELDCKRHSIVVEPLKFTAESKAALLTLENKYTVFNFQYSKGELKYNGLITTRNIITEDNRIKLFTKYINDCNQKEQYYKFICVSDQLNKLKEYIELYCKTAFNEFHLLLDEIDCMQEQSSFRDAMDECFSIYIDHEKKNRSLLSATITKFNDPRLEGECLTKIEYEIADKNNIKLNETPNVNERAKIIIEDILEKHPLEKIIIAYNHFKGIECLKEKLINMEIESKDIAVLCSESRSKESEPTKISRIKDQTLPSKINFITAAYFNGYDLKEKVHLIIIIDTEIPSLRLDPKTIYQIHGRLRNGAISAQIVVDFKSQKYHNYNVEILKKAIPELDNLIQSLNSLEKLKNKYLLDFSKKIKSWLIKSNENFSSIYTNENENLKISYLKMDSLLAKENTKKLLNNKNDYKRTLEKYFIIEYTETHNDLAETKEKETKESILEMLVGLNKATEIIDKSLRNLLYNLKTGNPISKKIINIILLSTQSDLILTKELIKLLIKRISTTEKWKEEIKNIETHVNFHCLITEYKSDNPNDEKNKIFNTFLIHHYKSNQNFKSAEFKTKHLIAIKTLSELCKHESKKIVSVCKSISTQDKIKKSLIEIKDTKIKGVRCKRVKNLNPFKILDLKKHPEFKMRMK